MQVAVSDGEDRNKIEVQNLRESGYSDALVVEDERASVPKRNQFDTRNRNGHTEVESNSDDRQPSYTTLLDPGQESARLFLWQIMNS